MHMCSCKYAQHIHVCMQTHKHTCAHIHAHRCAHTNTHMQKHASMHTQHSTHAWACRHTCRHVCTQTCTCTGMCMSIGIPAHVPQQGDPTMSTKWAQLGAGVSLGSATPMIPDGSHLLALCLHCPFTSPHASQRPLKNPVGQVGVGGLCKSTGTREPCEVTRMFHGRPQSQGPGATPGQVGHPGHSNPALDKTLTIR